MSFPFCFSFRVWRVFLMSLARIPVGAMNIFLLCHLYHLLEHFTTHYSRNKIVLTFHLYNTGWNPLLRKQFLAFHLLLNKPNVFSFYHLLGHFSTNCYFSIVVTAKILFHKLFKTSQELRMLSSVTINCQITKNSGSQLSEL